MARNTEEPVIPSSPARATASRPLNSTSDLTASNVPGIPVPVWLAGAKVERMYPLVGTIGAAINVTMLTYIGTASVGVSSDDAAVTDREQLMESLRHGFREVIGPKAITKDPLTAR